MGFVRRVPERCWRSRSSGGGLSSWKDDLIRVTGPLQAYLSTSERAKLSHRSFKPSFGLTDVRAGMQLRELPIWIGRVRSAAGTDR